MAFTYRIHLPYRIKQLYRAVSTFLPPKPGVLVPGRRQLRPMAERKLVVCRRSLRPGDSPC